jgi:hypothetical protein
MSQERRTCQIDQGGESERGTPFTGTASADANDVDEKVARTAQDRWRNETVARETV